MPNVTDDQSADAILASDQPDDGTTPDLEAIVQRAVAAALEQTDKRFQGFQSLMDKKLSDMSREFKTAGLSPEQQAQLAEEAEADEVQAMRRELDLHRMRDKFPKGVERLMKLAGATSLEDQLTLMESLVDAQVAAQEAEAVIDDGGTPVPEVDRNSPARPVTQGARSAVESGEMNDEIADAILDAG